jgi:NAD(P)-dependent dehydrogenase (short-subunit alcohol dehydrogenase family)
MNIAGSIALVTGGASGLGLATTQTLHASGASVVVFDLPGSNGLAVAREMGARAAFSAGDVTSPADVDAALDAAGALAGGVPRIVVNCAGVGAAARTTSRDGPFPLETPGLFNTPLLGNLSDEVIKSLGEQVPHPARLGDPREYAALVAHIAENPMLNGETIRLDGAIRMGPR